MKYFLVSDVVYALECHRCRESENEYYMYCHGCDMVECARCHMMHTHEHFAGECKYSARSVVRDRSVVNRVQNGA